MEEAAVTRVLMFPKTWVWIIIVSLKAWWVVSRSRAIRAEALDPDNASILVAGGGGVALLVTRKLKDMGSWVWVLQRSDSRRCTRTTFNIVFACM
jgi:hypothetical protein